MTKKLNFGPDFGPFDPPPPKKMFFVGFTSTGCLALWQDIVCSFKEN